MKIIIDFESFTDIDLKLIDALREIITTDSFCVKSRNRLKTENHLIFEHFEILKDLSNDTCNKCGCNEFLCGHDAKK